MSLTALALSLALALVSDVPPRDGARHDVPPFDVTDVSPRVDVPPRVDVSPRVEAPPRVDVPPRVAEDARDDAPARPTFMPYAFAVHASSSMSGLSAPLASVGVEIPVTSRVSVFRALAVATGKAQKLRAIPVPAAEGAVVGVKLAF